MIEGLPEKLILCRRSVGLTQREVADRLSGVSYPSIGAYETGARTPSAPVLMKLAALYGVSTDYLLGIETVNTATSIDVVGLTPDQVYHLRAIVESMKPKSSIKETE